MQINEYNTNSHETLIAKLKSLSRTRMENIYYTSMKQIINQKKFKQKVIKLEEFIDEIYSNDTQPFKTLIQTKNKFSNICDDFFQFNLFLVNLF